MQSKYAITISFTPTLSRLNAKVAQVPNLFSFHKPFYKSLTCGVDPWALNFATALRNEANENEIGTTKVSAHCRFRLESLKFVEAVKEVTLQQKLIKTDVEVSTIAMNGIVVMNFHNWKPIA